MTDATIGYGKNTWAGSGKPSDTHNGAVRLKMASGSAYAYVYLKTPVPDGRTVVSASLQVTVARTADWTGSKTLTARRIADQVPFGRLNWNNKPGVTGSSQPTATVSGATDGQVLTFDVTTHLQTVANGSDHYGWRLETSSTTAHKVYGFDSAHPPKLLVTYSDEPAQPTDLHPQCGAVSVAKPYLSFSANDLSNPGDLAAVQVQIDPAANETTPAYDSGWVTSSTPELDLSTTAYAGLADGASTQWRARVQNSTGDQGEWSEWVTFSRAIKGTVTPASPSAAAPVVTEATPPLLATFSGTLTAYRVLVYDQADHSVILADSGKADQAGGSIAWTLPKHVIEDNGAYTVEFRAFDGVDRVGTKGDPRYAVALQNFTFQHDATVAVPDSVTATQDGTTPWVNITIHSATAPDSFTITHNGKNVDADVDPGDILVSPGVYTYRYPKAYPLSAQHFGARRVVNGKASDITAAAPVTIVPAGIWLLDTDNDVAVAIYGQDPGSWAMPDQAATYTPAGSTETVRVVAGMRGLEGNITGVLVDAGGTTVADAKDALMGYKSHPAREFQLVLSDTSIPVRVGNLSTFPTPSGNGDTVVTGVSFDFWQSGDLPFRAV